MLTKVTPEDAFVLPSTKHRNETVFCPHTGSGAGEGEGRRVCSIEQESGAGSTATLSVDRRVASPERGVSRWVELAWFILPTFSSQTSHAFNFPPDSGEGKRGSKESPGVFRSRRASLP